MANQVKLIVRGDDFGMCHSVNEGIVRAFADGILTQSSVMVPCGWFAEAAIRIKEYGIPVGLHQTLTCEWDFMRWRPLTARESLMGSDGTFRRTVADAREAIDHADAVAELSAQAARFTAEGLEMEYLDVHMGAVAPDAYVEVADNLGQLFLYSELARLRGLTSITSLSDRDADGKKNWLLAYISELKPGVHMLVGHPAVAGPEIAAITGPDSSVVRWAEEYRASDFAVLTDPEVRTAVERAGIELTTVRKTIGLS